MFFLDVAILAQQRIGGRINLAIIFISMGFVAHSPPNYSAAASSLGVSQGPVVTAKFVDLPLYLKVGRYAVRFFLAIHDSLLR